MKQRSLSSKYVLVHPPALARTLQRMEAIVCAMLHSLVHIVFGAIAVFCFIVWCFYCLGCVLLWSVRGAIMFCMYTVVIIWLVVVWIGGQIRRLYVVLLRALSHLGAGVRWIVRIVALWALREFGEAVICTLCVYLGVLSTSVLPLALMLQIVPLATVSLVLSPFAAFVVAARVFDTHAYRRWQRGGRGRLGARLLRAYSDGITWAWWLRTPLEARRFAT